MVKARRPAAARAPRGPRAPAPEAGPVRKPKRKKRVWRNKAREAGRTPGDDPGVVAVRPPKAPEDFSPNWKALQELLKQRSQAPQEPLLRSQTDSKKQPQRVQQNRNWISDKAKRDAMGMEKTDPKAKGASGPSGLLMSRKIPAQPKEKGARKRTGGDVSPQQGGIKQKKRKAREPTAPLPPAPPTEDDIWFDDVDPADIEAAIGPEAASIARRQLGQSESRVTLVKERAFGGLTKALAMDCEMVGVGPEGEESTVARVSLVNQHGRCVYDKHVRPAQPVTDYRTAVSGVRPTDLAQGTVSGPPEEQDPGHSEVQAFQDPSEERTAISEAACRENLGDPGAAGRALFRPGRAGGNEAVCPGEEGLGEPLWGQAGPRPRGRQPGHLAGPHPEPPSGPRELRPRQTTDGAPRAAGGFQKQRRVACVLLS